MKLKKILAVVSALCMLCAVVPFSEKYVPETAISASAEDTEEYIEGTYENLRYKKYADYVEISYVADKEIEEANIPAEIDGLPVTSIGDWAFEDCGTLTSITIPNSVTSIGGYAFKSCYSLTSVTIPESVTSIGEYAFCNCYSLTSVTIPEGVTSISEGMFLFCENLTSVTIPESVTSISNNVNKAFIGTPWLKAKQEENPLVIVNGILIDGTTCEGDVTIPESVTSIGEYAFSDCSSLTSVTIPESVTSIGYGAFLCCSSLTSVTIENPDCEIYDSRNTISNGHENYNGYFNGTIYGYENSTAQAYTETYGYKFALIGSEPKTEELKQGDADGNGEIDILDVITINKAILGKENLSENGLKAIDFNGNGKPDSDEALTLLKYIVGIITDFNA